MVRGTTGAVDLSVTLCGLTLQNPLLSASGTFGYGLEFGSLTQLDRFGGLVTKGLSLEPIRGNPPQRIAETRGGMLNSIGLQNIGIEAFLRDVLPGLAGFPPKVFVNLFGTSDDEYARLAARVEPHEGVHAVELNVSCPNVKRGGIQFGQDAELLRRVVTAVRSETSKPVLVKLSPNVADPVALAQAAQDGGADALSAINTLVGMAIDSRTRRPLLATRRGGLSGPAVKPVALRIVFDIARAVDLPVVAIGGVETVDDVLEFLLAGASAVQVGTALFRRPDVVESLVQGLEERLRDDRVERVSDLIGAVILEEET